MDGVTSTNPHIYKRVIKEMIDVNEDFHTLRTVVTPSVSGMMNVFNFVMYPNDGAFCSLPLIGRIIIPNSYPKNPPVFHTSLDTFYLFDLFIYLLIIFLSNGHLWIIQIILSSLRNSWKHYYRLWRSKILKKSHSNHWKSIWTQR